MCLDSSILLHMRTFHQKDPVLLLARTMTASSRLALALCWLLAGREHRAAPMAVSTCVCQPMCQPVGWAEARCSPVSAQSGGFRSPEWRGVASGWRARGGDMEQVAHEWDLKGRGGVSTSSVLPGFQCLGD